MKEHKGWKIGRHFLQIPGPSNVPDQILGAIAKPTIDHRGPEFAQMSVGIFERLKFIFQTSQPVIIYPSSGTGAWEAALVNTLSPGDKVLMFENGYFATLWRDVAVRLGLEVEWVHSDWRYGVDPAIVEEKLVQDKKREIKAIAIVHNETSTGAVSHIHEIRQAIDRAGHPSLLMVDTISSLASIDYRHDEWGVDVSISSSQKGLMLPPGLSFNAISEKAREISKTAALSKSYWDWEPVLRDSERGYFPYTPASNLLFGLDEALSMLLEEGLENVFKRHQRLGEATRQAVRGWGLEIFCADPDSYSNTVTSVLIPEGHPADALRKLILERYNLSLGTGLGKLKGQVFRIGHLGDFNDLMLAGTLCGIEMGLDLAGVPFHKEGVKAALKYLSDIENDI